MSKCKTKKKKKNNNIGCVTSVITGETKIKPVNTIWKQQIIEQLLTKGYLADCEAAGLVFFLFL